MNKKQSSNLTLWAVMIFLVAGVIMALLSEIKCDANNYSFDLLKATTCYCSPWNSWANRGCGSGGCSTNKMYQTRARTCTPSYCSTTQESRCYSLGCTNECSYSGQKRCSGTNVQTCGNYDSDCCLEWSSTKSCSGSTSCGYGSCYDNEKPRWYCSSNQCVYSCYNAKSSCCPLDCLAGTYFCSNNKTYWCHSVDGCYKKDLKDDCDARTNAKKPCLSGKYWVYTCVNGQASCKATCSY